jgi:hypothetical protein
MHQGFTPDNALFKVIQQRIANQPLIAIMATLQSGYEPKASRSPASTGRRYSAYDDPAAIESFRSATRCFPSLTNNTNHEDPDPRSTALYESNIELDAFNANHDRVGAAEPEFSLPPVDGGKDAWLFLLSAFVLEVLVWGTASSPDLRPPY